MLEIDFLVSIYIDTVGVKSPGLNDTFVKLSDTLRYKNKKTGSFLAV